MEMMRRGLSSAEVALRQAEGRANRVVTTTSRSRREIVRSNLFTRFNALVLALAAVIVVVGQPFDLTFAAIMVLNTIVGVSQELRAKKTLDGLQVLIASTVDVVRDGEVRATPVGGIVPDDLLVLRTGDQVPVDGTVVFEEGFETDESSLTGEADPVAKCVGSEVRSGSSVVAGTANVVATHVGEEAWVRRLEAQARAFDPARSELRESIDRLLRWIGWAVLPLAALLVWSQQRSGQTVEAGLVAAVAGVVALVPQGLVLLVSMSMATAVVRLSRHQVVVRELPAVEGLARVDVICLDKTGTLTTGRLALDAIEPLGASEGDLRVALGALASIERTPTPVFGMLATMLGSPPDWATEEVVAFSSVHKWSGATFTGRGTWLVGAPEVLLDAMGPGVGVASAGRVDELTAAAHRVLLVAYSPHELDTTLSLPKELVPMGLVVMSEELRPDAASTMRYFQEQGVTVKVISGDSPRTVSAVATQLGIPSADRQLDMRTVEGSLDDLVESTTVFGRVQPEQKRELVEALQRGGHVVAMTGDGVNDIPALKAADIGIAMNNATTATKAVAELVLLNGRFDLLPSVVAEGRRVLANMERVSALFITKTVYAAVFALAAGVSQQAYPFLPRHIALVADLTIGIPAFLLGFRPSARPAEPGYLRRVARFSVPAGLTTAAVTLLVFSLLRSSLFETPLANARTAAVLTLATCEFWVLYRLVRPLDRYEATLITALLSAFAGVFAIRPVGRLYELHLPSVEALATMAVLLSGCLLVLQLALNRTRAL